MPGGGMGAFGGKPIRDKLSNSKRRTFTRCRRMFWFEQVERLEPKVGSPPLRFGSLIHACLKSFYTDKQVLFDSVCNRWADEYRAELVGANLDEGYEPEVDEEKIEKLRELAKGMMRGYLERYASDHAKFEIVAAEQPFRFPLRVPCSKCRGESLYRKDKSCECGGTGIGRRSPKWDYTGIIDLLVRDVQSGVLWLREHKTTVESDTEKYMSGLLLDTQPRGYVWAARRLAAEHGWGRVAGIEYNVMRKKVPVTPKTTQCKSCKGSGRPTKTALKAKPSLTSCPSCAGTGVGGISKAATDTTSKLFLQALKDHPHIDASEYSGIISMLQARGDRFFWRQWHHVSEFDVADWLLEMYQVTRDIDTTDRFYRNPDACDANGRKCPYRRICVEDDPIARRNFRVRGGDDLPEFAAAAKASDIGF